MEEQELINLQARIRDRIRDTNNFSPEDAAGILGIPNPDAETLARIHREYIISRGAFVRQASLKQCHVLRYAVIQLLIIK